MTDGKWRKQCAVDGLFVTGCSALEKVAELPHGKSKGIKKVSTHNTITGKPFRTYYMVRSGDHKERGLILNFCPMCGTDISKMFRDEEKQNHE